MFRHLLETKFSFVLKLVFDKWIVQIMFKWNDCFHISDPFILFQLRIGKVCTPCTLFGSLQRVQLMALVGWTSSGFGQPSAAADSLPGRLDSAHVSLISLHLPHASTSPIRLSVCLCASLTWLLVHLRMALQPSHQHQQDPRLFNHSPADCSTRISGSHSLRHSVLHTSSMFFSLCWWLTIFYISYTLQLATFTLSQPQSVSSLSNLPVPPHPLRKKKYSLNHTYFWT